MEWHVQAGDQPCHGYRPIVILTSDFNGDGKPDIATLNATNSDISVLLSGATRARSRRP